MLKDILYKTDLKTYQDKSVHIITKYNLWTESDTKIEETTQLASGAVQRELFCNDFGSEGDLEEYISNWLAEYVTGYEEKHEIEKFSTLDKVTQTLITEVLEDVIKQNIEFYLYE